MAYECAACGVRLVWTSTADHTPEAFVEHTEETGHVRFAMVLD